MSRCYYLYVYVLEGEFEQLVEHLKRCAQCNEDLENEFEFYQKFPQLFEGMTPGISSKEDFLKEWILNIQFQSKLGESLRTSLVEKVRSLKGCCILIKFLRQISRIVRLKNLKAPETILKDELKLIRNSLREIYAFLGPDLFEFLFGEKATVERMMDDLASLIFYEKTN